MKCAYTSSYSVSTSQVVRHIPTHTVAAVHFHTTSSPCSLLCRWMCSVAVYILSTGRFSWRLLDWTAEQLERFQLPAEFHVKNATAQLDIRQIPDSLAADGLPRYCLGSSRSFSDSSREARSLMLHTALLGREIREKLRVQLPLRDKTSNEPHNLAVIAGQSKVELCHPAGTAVIVL